MPDDNILRMAVKRMYVGNNFIFYRNNVREILEHVQAELGGNIVLRRSQPNNANKLFEDWAIDKRNDGPEALHYAAEKLLPYALLYAPGWRVHKLNRMIQEKKNA